MALLSPFQRALPPHSNPGASAVLPSLLLAPWASSPVLCLCSVVLEGRTGGSGFYSELYLRTFFFIGGSMAPAACTRSSVVHFQSTLFQTKGQNLIVPMVSFILCCCPVWAAQGTWAPGLTSSVASTYPLSVRVRPQNRICLVVGDRLLYLPGLLTGWPGVAHSTPSWSQE